MLSRGRRWGRLLLLWLALISTIIVVVTLCSIPLFVGWIRWDHLDRVAGVSPARLLHNYLNMWSYLYMPWVHRLWLPDFRVSVNGATHFADVQHLFVLNLIVMVVSLPLSWRWLQQLRRNQQGYVLRTSAWGGLAVIMALLVAMGINFNGFFSSFFTKCCSVTRIGSLTRRWIQSSTCCRKDSLPPALCWGLDY
nr:DUF1461 domain-containing protein [Lacticaseibacillus thailandensis]